MPDAISVGRITVDLARHRLAAAGRELGIEPRAAQVLALLCAHRGQVVARNRIFEEVWRGAEVTDDALNRTIFDLRRAFSSLEPGADPIETIRKVGYRLREPDPIRTGLSARTATTAAVVMAGLLALGWWWLAKREPAIGLAGPPRALTTALGLEYHPDYSATTGLLAFSCQENGAVAICALDPSDPASSRILIEAPARGGRWSPDARIMVYQRLSPECQIRIRRLDDGADSLLRPCRARNDGSIAWSPDGDWIYWSDRSSAEGPFAVYRATAGGDSWSRVSAPPSGAVGDLFPSLSPDGRMLALFRAATPDNLSTYITPGDGHILVQDLENGDASPRQLTQAPRTVTGLVWLDRNTLLAIHSDGAGFGFWRYPLDGPPSRIGLAQGGIARSPAIVGGELVYESWEAEADLLKLDLESGESRVVASSTRYDFNPSLSPDARYLALVSTRSGQTQIWLAPADHDAAPQPLTSFERGEVHTPSWSPDGRQLGGELREAGRSRIFVLDFESRELEWLDLPGNNRVPVFDDDRMLVSSDRTGRWEIWSHDLFGGDARQLSVGGGFASRPWTPAGEAPGIVYSRLGTGGLYFQRGEAPRRLPLDLAPEHWGNWQVLDDRVIALVRDETGSQILESWDGIELKAIIALPRPMLRESVNLSLSADGKTLVYSTRTGISANLVRVALHGNPGSGRERD